MIDSLYIAWCYLRHHWGRSVILITCVTLIAALPLSLQLLLDESEQQLLARAEATPLLVGARGSSLDLVMHSLYFGDSAPEPITMKVVDQVADSGLALPIPLYLRFKARAAPLVGTTLDYFEFRGLELASGRQLALLGDCVLGAEVARRLGLGPGDSLLSSPEALFDLAGVYPLKMRVVGVLAPSHSADDLAVFIDLKTSWVVQGLVHGHADLQQVTDPTLVTRGDSGRITATAKLNQYTEITPENIDSFHVHGDPADYPISAVIALPDDARAAALLRGRHVSGGTEQVLVPAEVVSGLLADIFRIKSILDAVIAMVGLATVLALLLVFSLSLRLRQRELDTIFKLGCSRATVAHLLGAEIVIILVAAAILAAAILALVELYDETLVRTLFIR